MYSATQTQLPALENNQDRIFKFDFLRAVAMIFVVAVHCLVVIDFQDTFSLFYFQTMQAVFFTCNALFFMLSGKFALKPKSDLGNYYKQKVKNILIPMLLFFLIRTVYEELCKTNPYDGIVEGFFLNTLGGLRDTEYWYLFELIGNLMLAPLLGKAFAAFTENQHKLISILIYVFHIFMFGCAVAGIVFGYEFPLSGWSFYFYLGYSIEYIIKKPNAFLYLTGALALMITVLLKYKGITVYVHDISPIFTVLVVAMYFFLSQCSGLIFEKLKGVIRFIAKHSFTVYLTHMMILEQMQRIMPKVTGSLSILYHILFTVIITALSLLIAFVLDNYVIKFAQIGVEKIYLYSKKRNKKEETEI